MNIPPAFIKQFGLRAPIVPPRRRLVMTSEGEPGSGKSDFGLRSAPRPMVVINLDQNLEGIEERYEGEDILVKDVKMPILINKEKDLATFVEIRDLYLKSVDLDYFRTILIDTGDALYELIRRGYLGALGFGEAKQSDFDVVNANMRKFFRAAKEKRVNMIMSHRRADEYKTVKNTQTGKNQGEKSGKRKRVGWKDAEYEAQCHVLFEKDETDGWSKNSDADYDTKNRLNRFSMTIKKCTANESVEGTVFRGDMISFPVLGTTVFPASDWSDWE